jgi:hypothetical protein
MSGTGTTEDHVHVDMRQFVKELARHAPTDPWVIPAHDERRRLLEHPL